MKHSPTSRPMGLRSLFVRSETVAVFTSFPRSAANRDYSHRVASVRPFRQKVRKYFSLLAMSIPQPTSSHYKEALHAQCVQIGQSNVDFGNRTDRQFCSLAGDAVR